MIRSRRFGVLTTISVILLATACKAEASGAVTPACSIPQSIRAGWETSFSAACLDANGKYAGGSQIMHLVSHKGTLFAANSYWTDQATAPPQGSPRRQWAQVLRLDGHDKAWQVDLELGPKHLRTELLKSVRFTQDANGKKLPEPVSLLLAATYDGAGKSVTVFVRDDEQRRWSETRLFPRGTGEAGPDNSVRAAAVHIDPETGRENLFLSVGVLGLVKGSFDPAVPGKIRWNKAPESGTATDTRILATVEANGDLFYSDATRIYRYVEGAKTPTVVADFSSETDSGTDRLQLQSIGGIRGLTAIDGPVADKQSLIFVWHGGARRSSRGCVRRLDPKPDGSYAVHEETCLDAAVSKHLGGAPVSFILAAYNNFLPVQALGTGETLHLIGLEAFIPNTREGARFQSLLAGSQRTVKGGMYAGGLIAIRNASGQWTISEVNGDYRSGDRELVSIYTLAKSPFAEGGHDEIYAGGYDPNGNPSPNAAWVMRAPLKSILESVGK
jgi:poly(A) polymerase